MDYYKSQEVDENRLLIVEKGMNGWPYETEQKQMTKYKRLLLAGGIAVLVVLFFTTGPNRHLSLESVKASQSQLQQAHHQHPTAALAVFSAVYIPVVALNLPGAVVLGLAAGAIFGALAGTIIISFAGGIGAALACLLARYLLRDWVQRRFGEKLKWRII